MQLDDGVLLLLGKVAALYIRPEVINPSQSAALATSQKPCTQKNTNGLGLFRSSIVHEHTHDGWFTVPLRK